MAALSAAISAKNPGEERSDEQSAHEDVKTRRLLNNPGRHKANLWLMNDVML